MATIADALQTALEGKAALGTALQDKLGLQDLKGSNGKWKTLNEWAQIITAMNIQNEDLTFSDTGNGDIATSVYNGSETKTISYNSIGAAKQLQVNNLTDTSINYTSKLTPGIYNYTNPLTSLNFGNGSIPSDNNEEIIIYFTAGTNCQVSLPANTKIIGNLDVAAGNKYVISILDGIFVMKKVNLKQ